MSTPTSFDFVARKVGVIAYASIINFYTTAYASKWVKKYIMLEHTAKHPAWRNHISLSLNVVLIAVLAYVLRQISDLIPLPFGTESFIPIRVKEVKGSVLTAFTMFLFLGSTLKSFPL